MNKIPEPRLIVGRNHHDEGCGIDHDPFESDCYTRDDFLADEGDREYDRMKDGYE